MSDLRINQRTQSTNKSFFRLPRKFVHQPRGSSPLPALNLPFIGADRTKVGGSYWAVPKTGGYWGGCETGRALAHIYLKYLHQHGPECEGYLDRIALDMFDSDCPVDEAQWTRRGQAVGFFSVLYTWLCRGIQHAGQELDALDDIALLEAANAGLNFDSEAYESSLFDE